MSRHNIKGSEAFERQPFVYIRDFGRKARPRVLTVLAGATIGVAAVGALGFAAWAGARALGLL